MQIKPIVAALGLVLAGCSDHPRIDGAAGATVATLGTPFLIAFKAPLCVVTLALAGPSAAGLELTGYERTTDLDLRRELDQGVRQNCGVPYVVTP
jgi:hypothetical protein